jgi:branched-chain amino acid transport system permease protein
MLLHLVLREAINGLMLGSFYSLVALGYSMVYGIIKLLNFAHGDIYMTSAFVGLAVLTGIGSTTGRGWLGVGVTLLITMALAGVLGVLIELVAYRPLLKRQAPRMSLLITAIGVSFTLFNGVMVMTHGEYRAFRTDIGFNGASVGGVVITYTQMVLVSTTLAIMLGLFVFVKRTMYGKAMRAIAMDKDACRLMGINVDRTIALTFFIGSALAAAGGIMAGVYYGSIHFFMGFVIGLKAFTAAVIGGIGSIPGAMLGGLVLGLLESFGTMGVGSAWKDVFAFVALILLLVTRPTGILGKSEIERM